MPVVEKQIPTNKRGMFRTVEEYEPPKLRTWAELTEECPVPGDIAAALSTGRPQLIRDVKRPLTAEEGQQLVNLIRVLIDTNRELQEHCSLVAQKVERVQDNMKGLVTGLVKLQDLANFRTADEDDDE